MSLNEVMARLRDTAPQPTEPETPTAEEPMEPETPTAEEPMEPETPTAEDPMVVPDQQPTMRDLATAFYRQKQQPTCRNCIHRERGDCPSRSPMPKQCFSFQLNSRQMATYGAQARNAIAAWRESIAIHAARTAYAERKKYERQINQIQL